MSDEAKVTAIGGIPLWRKKFLILWDKAVGRSDYSKVEWQECEQEIFDAFASHAERKPINYCGYCGMAVHEGTAFIILKKTNQHFHLNCVDYAGNAKVTP